MSEIVALGKFLLDKVLPALPKIKKFFLARKQELSADQIDKIKRDLRLLYFRTDYILAELRAIQETRGEDKSIFRNLRRKLAESDRDAETAIRFLLSNEIIGNLSIRNDTVTDLREVGNLKTGIRAHLKNFVSAFDARALTEADLKLLDGIQDSIAKLNDRIDDILTALDAPLGTKVRVPTKRVSGAKKKSASGIAKGRVARSGKNKSQTTRAY